MKNLDLLEKDKKKFVVSTSKWIKLYDIDDWSIFDPKRMYVIKKNNVNFPIMIKWDFINGLLISDHPKLHGIEIDEFSHCFDNYFIKEFKMD